MTETDKAREWYRASFEQRWKWVSDHSLSSEDRITLMLAAYGAAQYEAGAASERKRAKATVIGHHRFSHDGPCPKDCYYETTEKMPLREKEGQ